tara:strand:+ start:30018 stop:40274 length:10257 start_codon:yes stop_codon:yes gene_type:complete
MAGRFTQDKRGQCVWEENLCCGKQGDFSGRYNWYVAPHHYGFLSISGIHPPMVGAFDLGFEGCYNVGNPMRNESTPTYGYLGPSLNREPGQDVYFQKYPRYGPVRARASYNPYCGTKMKCDFCKPDPGVNRIHEGYWSFVQEGKWYNTEVPDENIIWSQDSRDGAGSQEDGYGVRNIYHGLDPSDEFPGVGFWGGDHYCGNAIPTVLDDVIFKQDAPQCEYRRGTPHIVLWDPNPTITNLANAGVSLACGGDNFMWRRGRYMPTVTKGNGARIDGWTADRFIFSGQIDAFFMDVGQHFWNHKNCPMLIHRQMHSSGGTIHACPQDHLVIPYYAAMGLYSYFGTRYYTPDIPVLNHDNPTGHGEGINESKTKNNRACSFACPPFIGCYHGLKQDQENITSLSDKNFKPRPYDEHDDDFTKEQSYGVLDLGSVHDYFYMGMTFAFDETSAYTSTGKQSIPRDKGSQVNVLGGDKNNNLRYFNVNYSGDDSMFKCFLSGPKDKNETDMSSEKHVDEWDARPGYRISGVHMCHGSPHSLNGAAVCGGLHLEGPWDPPKIKISGDGATSENMMKEPELKPVVGYPPLRHPSTNVITGYVKQFGWQLLDVEVVDGGWFKKSLPLTVYPEGGLTSSGHHHGVVTDSQGAITQVIDQMTPTVVMGKAQAMPRKYFFEDCKYLASGVARECGAQEISKYARYNSHYLDNPKSTRIASIEECENFAGKAWRQISDKIPNLVSRTQFVTIYYSFVPGGAAITGYYNPTGSDGNKVVSYTKNWEKFDHRYTHPSDQKTFDAWSSASQGEFISDVEAAFEDWEKLINDTYSLEYGNPNDLKIQFVNLGIESSEVGVGTGNAVDDVTWNKEAGYESNMGDIRIALVPWSPSSQSSHSQDNYAGCIPIPDENHQSIKLKSGHNVGNIFFHMGSGMMGWESNQTNPWLSNTGMNTPAYKGALRGGKIVRSWGFGVEPKTGINIKKVASKMIGNVLGLGTGTATGEYDIMAQSPMVTGQFFRTAISVDSSLCGGESQGWPQCPVLHWNKVGKDNPGGDPEGDDRVEPHQVFIQKTPDDTKSPSDSWRLGKSQYKLNDFLKESTPYGHRIKTNPKALCTGIYNLDLGPYIDGGNEQCSNYEAHDAVYDQSGLYEFSRPNGLLDDVEGICLKFLYLTPPEINLEYLKDPNFTCGDPLIIQQPMTRRAKMGSKPKLRIEALEYHAIPQSKFHKWSGWQEGYYDIQENAREGSEDYYPEIEYWRRRLSLHPSGLKYRWYRIPNTEDCINREQSTTTRQLEAFSFASALSQGDPGAVEGEPVPLIQVNGIKNGADTQELTLMDTNVDMSIGQAVMPDIKNKGRGYLPQKKNTPPEQRAYLFFEPEVGCLGAGASGFAYSQVEPDMNGQSGYLTYFEFIDSGNNKYSCAVRPWVSGGLDSPIQQIQILKTGHEFESKPNVTVTPAGPIYDGYGAKIEPLLDGGNTGTLTGFNIIDSGQCYSSEPIISVDGGNPKNSGEYRAVIRDVNHAQPLYEIGTGHNKGYSPAKNNKYFTRGCRKGVFDNHIGEDQYSYYCVVEGRFGSVKTNCAGVVLDAFIEFDVNIENRINYDLEKTEIQFIGPKDTYTFERDTKIARYPAWNESQGGAWTLDTGIQYNESDYWKEEVWEEGRYMANNCWRGKTFTRRPDVSYPFHGAYDQRKHKARWTAGHTDYGVIWNFKHDNITQKEADFFYGMDPTPDCDVDTMMQVNECNEYEEITHDPETGEELESPYIKHVDCSKQEVTLVDGTTYTPEGHGEMIAIHQGIIGKTYLTYEGLSDRMEYKSLHCAGSSMYANDPKWEDGGYRWPADVYGWPQWRFGCAINHGYGDKRTAGVFRYDNYKPMPDESRDLFLWSFVAGANPAGSGCLGYGEEGGGFLSRRMLLWFEEQEPECWPKGKTCPPNINYQGEQIMFQESDVQFSWLRAPNDVELQWEDLPGPYAFHWKANKHNRDRNDNGYPEFLTLSMNRNDMTWMQDQLSIYGAYTNSDYHPEIQDYICTGIDPNDSTRYIHAANLNSKYSLGLTGHCWSGATTYSRGVPSREFGGINACTTCMDVGNNGPGVKDVNSYFTPLINVNPGPYSSMAYVKLTVQYPLVFNHPVTSKDGGCFDVEGPGYLSYQMWKWGGGKEIINCGNRCGPEYEKNNQDSCTGPMYIQTCEDLDDMQCFNPQDVHHLIYHTPGGGTRCAGGAGVGHLLTTNPGWPTFDFWDFVDADANYCKSDTSSYPDAPNNACNPGDWACDYTESTAYDYRHSNHVGTSHPCSPSHNGGGFGFDGMFALTNVKGPFPRSSPKPGGGPDDIKIGYGNDMCDETEGIRWLPHLPCGNPSMVDQWGEVIGGCDYLPAFGYDFAVLSGKKNRDECLCFNGSGGGFIDTSIGKDYFLALGGEHTCCPQTSMGYNINNFSANYLADFPGPNGGWHSTGGFNDYWGTWISDSDKVPAIRMSGDYPNALSGDPDYIFAGDCENKWGCPCPPDSIHVDYANVNPCNIRITNFQGQHGTTKNMFPAYEGDDAHGVGCFHFDAGGVSDGETYPDPDFMYNGLGCVEDGGCDFQFMGFSQAGDLYNPSLGSPNELPKKQHICSAIGQIQNNDDKSCAIYGDIGMQQFLWKWRIRQGVGSWVQHCNEEGECYDTGEFECCWGEGCGIVGDEWHVQALAGSPYNYVAMCCEFPNGSDDVYPKDPYRWGGCGEELRQFPWSFEEPEMHIYHSLGHSSDAGFVNHYNNYDYHATWTDTNTTSVSASYEGQEETLCDDYHNGFNMSEANSSPFSYPHNLTEGFMDIDNSIATFTWGGKLEYSRPGAWKYEYSGMRTERAWKDAPYYIGGFLTIEDITEDKYNHVVNSLGADLIEEISENDREIIRGIGKEYNWSGYMIKSKGEKHEKDEDIPAPAGMQTIDVGGLFDGGMHGPSPTGPSSSGPSINSREQGDPFKVGTTEVKQQGGIAFAEGQGMGWSTMYKEWSDDNRLTEPGWYSGQANWPPPHTCLTNQCWIGTDAPECFFRTYSDSKYKAVTDSEGQEIKDANGNPIPHTYSGAYIYPDRHGQFVNPILREMGYYFPIQLRMHSSLNIGQYWHADGTGFLNGAGTMDSLTETHKLVSSLDALYLPILSEIGYMAQFSWDERWAISNGWGHRVAEDGAGFGFGGGFRLHGMPAPGDYWGRAVYGSAAWENPGNRFVTDETIHPMGVAAVRGRHNMQDPSIAFWYHGVGNSYTYMHLPTLWSETTSYDLFGPEDWGYLYEENRISPIEMFSRDDACPALGENRDFRVRQFLYWKSDAGQACMYVTGNFADNASLEFHVPKDSLKRFYCGDPDKAKYTSNAPEGMIDPDTDEYYFPNWDKNRWPKPSAEHGECQELWNFADPYSDGHVYMGDPELEENYNKKFTPDYLDKNVVAEGMDFIIGSSTTGTHH